MCIHMLNVCLVDWCTHAALVCICFEFCAIHWYDAIVEIRISVYGNPILGGDRWIWLYDRMMMGVSSGTIVVVRREMGKLYKTSDR